MNDPNLSHAKKLTPYTRLRLATIAGWESGVEKLIKEVDPKKDQSLVLRSAAINGHESIVKLLIPVSDVVLAHEILSKDFALSAIKIIEEQLIVLGRDDLHEKIKPKSDSSHSTLKTKIKKI